MHYRLQVTVARRRIIRTARNHDHTASIAVHILEPNVISSNLLICHSLDEIAVHLVGGQRHIRVANFLLVLECH